MSNEVQRPRQDALAELERLVIEGPVEEVPDLLGEIARIDRLGELRLNTPPSVGPEAAQRWITAEDAGKIARVSKKVVYEWAIGQSWAVRPTRRCLRINEAEYRSWLAMKRGRR